MIKTILVSALLAAMPIPSGLDRYADWLARLQDHYPDRDQRLIAWARARMGTPYVLDCQGEGAGQDPDPLFTPWKLDCTVFTLQAAASLDARTTDEVLSGMKVANYRRVQPDGSVRFEDRYHYSEDRISASPLFRDITQQVFPARDLVREHIVLNRAPDGTLAMPIPWDRPLDLVYRPTANFTAADVAKLPPVCGVLFVKRANRKLGMLIGHEGIVIHGRVLIHASSVQKRVVMQPFVPYARTRDGVLIYTFEKR